MRENLQPVHIFRWGFFSAPGNGLGARPVTVALIRCNQQRRLDASFTSQALLIRQTAATWFCT